MGINGKLKQLSPYLLETFKEDPVFVWLFLDSKYMIDLDYWQYVQDFPANCAYNFPEEISQLQAIEKDRAKDYQKIKTDILIEGENTELDLHKIFDLLETEIKYCYLVDYYKNILNFHKNAVENRNF